MADEKILTHLDEDGRPRMVDVGGKSVTQRRAKAGCVVRLSAETFRLLIKKALPKGDALGSARIAGIMAAKRTPELIPLCHPLPVTYADVDFEMDEQGFGIRVVAEVRCEGRTGVEMEALTAASVAALTIYDMCKAVQKDIVIDGLRLLHKSGGRSGEYEYKAGW
jgi:cyclic pyranopterin phosphate synthase